MLMDGRRSKANGEDGAEQRNARELAKLSARSGKPILRIRAGHDRPAAEKDLRAELIDDGEF